ncbi:winged helix-turn-helix domain-containing protein [Methanolobus sediminis]|uniref:Winged helix-turn-helix domain-containing protein n=1 Tax=Methanolobus sediminis TaxID=3072978 RepID=A0AA51YMG2_9EURY|nr:winged helix-turn-helix domain-containing protein [Methanolobus sediminis]WMW25573.1 winged helix-turn-helix domain-containing protein [Methanolobus sediminis]
MKKRLLDVAFASEKRMNVLLSLQDGAKEMATLLELTDTNRNSLLPQMKILEEHYMVIHYNDTYELTTIGKLIVADMVPLLDKIDVIDIDVDYWGNRDLDFIPSPLLEKIGQLKNCEIINPPITELFSMHKSFNTDYKVSTRVYVVTTTLYPNFESIIAELLESNVDFYYIVSQELLDKLRTEYHKELTSFINNEFFHMYVYTKEMKFLYFTFDDVHSLISAFNKKGEFDHKFMLCKGQSAVDWTKELYNSILEDSIAVAEI